MKIYCTWYNEVLPAIKRSFEGNHTLMLPRFLSLDVWAEKRPT